MAVGVNRRRGRLSPPQIVAPLVHWISVAAFVLTTRRETIGRGVAAAAAGAVAAALFRESVERMDRP